MDKKLIFENNLCKFYINDMCESLTNYCETYLNNFPPLKNYKVYICEAKDGEISYVLFNEKGEPIAQNNLTDGMAIEIEKLRFLKNINKY